MSSMTTASMDYLWLEGSGLSVTVIDFGLSRLDRPNGGAIYTPLPEEVYEGVGAQWDVYRSMREMIGDDWEGYHPRTNVLVRPSVQALEAGLQPTVAVVHCPSTFKRDEITAET